MSFFKRSKRNFLRIKEHHLLKYKVIEGAEEEEDLSSAKDLGGGGVFFQSSEKIPEGENIEVKVNLPPYPKPVKAIAKVLRAKPLRKGKGFNIAAEFIKIDEQAQLFIEQKIALVKEKEKKDKLRKTGLFFTVALLVFLAASLFLKFKGIYLEISYLIEVGVFFLLFFFAVFLLKRK